MYACTAETEGRGRCRNAAQDNDRDGLCSSHAQQRDSGKNIKRVSRPGRVLVKANINQSWFKRFTALGIPVKTPDFAKQEAAHVADAQRVGREAYAVRKNIADSGVQVFGKDGVASALMVEPLDSLLVAYRLTDMHIFQRRDKGLMNVLVLTYEAGTEGDKKITLPVAIAEFFAMSSWGYAHVWANPPKEDGVVLHTINLSHRSDEPAARQLLFADGLWAVEKVAS